MRFRRIECFFLHTLAFALACLLALPATGEEATSQLQLLMQSSPLAGSQFYALKTVREKIRVGDALTLAREPDNPYDANAVRVEWQGEKLGYVPRRENHAVAAALTRGDPLTAVVSRVTDDPDPWKRLEFEIWLRF
ncbi:MAG: HIRAN domain-containing protein [Zoogloeaceae bacterium]|jgi:hypothetical protein|nr:HIRAN domain-containing protein [Zoogloeaceae bacterium]